MVSAKGKRLGWWALGLAAVAVLVWQLVNSGGGTPDPTDPTEHLSHLAVVLDSGILVLREGLETILVLAVLTASLLVVMNWFFHRVYWTGWIAHHNRRRKALIGEAGSVSAQRTLLGLALLGFTSVYREGFEVVLFLQNLRLRYGSTTVLEGVAVGLVFVAAIGYVTFGLQQRLPYRRMLVATGVMLGFVLLVMVGESVQELQQAGWIGTTPIHVAVPAWMGTWFSVFPNVETIVAQVLAAALVIGSYFLAEEVRVRRPRRRGATPAVRPTAPPSRSRLTASGGAAAPRSSATISGHH
jgi:high-affinity iron transporter